MSDTTVIEQEPDTAPVEHAPSQLPADSPIGSEPATDDELSQLLREFEETARPAESTADNVGAQPDGQSDLDKLLGELDGPSPDQQKITELEGQITSFAAAELNRQLRQQFDEFADELQSRCGPHVDGEFARTNLLAMAAQDPNLELAWRYHNLTDKQLKEADAEFRQLQVLHVQALATPGNDPRKQQIIAALERRGQELGFAMNARAMIANARRAVLKRAEQFKPIDVEATADRDAIVQAIREGQGPINIPEEKPNFGIMDDRTFRDYTKRHYGF